MSFKEPWQKTKALPCEFECSVRKYRLGRASFRGFGAVLDRKVKRRRRNQFLIAGDPSQQGQEQVLQPEVQAPSSTA